MLSFKADDHDALKQVLSVDPFSPLLGDQGSGYAIGFSILSSVVQAVDGRGPATSLVDAVFSKLNIQNVPTHPLTM